MTHEETMKVASCIRLLTQVINELQEARYTCEDPQRIGAIRELTRDIRGMLGTLRTTEHRNVIKSIRKIS
jgi:hypothetical protein